MRRPGKKLREWQNKDQDYEQEGGDFDSKSSFKEDTSNAKQVAARTPVNQHERKFYVP